MRRSSPPPGPAAGPDSWPAAGPAGDPWDILPVSAALEAGQPTPETGQPTRRQGHRGRRRLVRSPLAWTVLLAGLAAVAGGAIGLSRLTGHPGEVARPLATTSPAPHGNFAPPPLPRTGRRMPRPVSLAIPAIGVRTSLIKLGRTPQGTLQVPTSTSVAGWYTASPRPGEI